ncbi:two component transcriptional regulator, LytTR family [Fibrobacter intestinalis]|uniref:Two component transcriptional regulator, LytTR family n=2 Tax=Fibrobacter intestinalis TaxID=28122 RepID=A0A1M6PUW1_9BACT|nr:two component transcriptional regulator, LytTR family [Fibrobacter intestinalis]
MDCSNPSKKDIAVNYIKAMQFKTLIVDDEPLARMRMRKLLEPYADLVTIAGEAATGEEAVNLIRQIHPDLVFLDIQMPDKNGFDVLKEVDAEEDPLIVFTTAYDEYALKAFAEYTIDYLLKPIEEERLQVCMDKVRRLGGILGGSVDTEKDMQRLLNRSPSDQQTYLRRIQAKIGDRTIVIPIENIFRFQSEEKYTTVYASNGKFIISTPLIELEKRLDPAQFVRVHRAHLIAIDTITEYQRLPNGHFTIKLHDKDHSVIPVSRNFVSNLHSL